MVTSVELENAATAEPARANGAKNLNCILIDISERLGTIVVEGREQKSIR